MVRKLSPVPEEVINALLAQIGAATALSYDEAKEEICHWLKVELPYLPDWPGADITFEDVVREGLARLQEHTTWIKENSLDRYDMDARMRLNSQLFGILQGAAFELGIRL